MGGFRPEKDVAAAATTVDVGDVLNQEEKGEEVNKKFALPAHLWDVRHRC